MTTNVQSDPRAEVSALLTAAADIAGRLGCHSVTRDLADIAAYVLSLPAGDSFALELGAVARGERGRQQKSQPACPYGCGTYLRDTGRDLECARCGCAWAYASLQGARP